MERLFWSILESISMAKRLGTPSMAVGSLSTFWSKQSDRLWAGSVEMISTYLPCSARRVAMEEEVVVLPTPPLPPTKIQRRVLSSTRF